MRRLLESESFHIVTYLPCTVVFIIIIICSPHRNIPTVIIIIVISVRPFGLPFFRLRGSRCTPRSCAHNNIIYFCYESRMIPNMTIFNNTVIPGADADKYFIILINLQTSAVVFFNTVPIPNDGSIEQ